MWMQQVCILCCSKKCLHREACGFVWVVSEWKLWMCMLRGKEEGVFFLSSFFLPLSMSVLYPTPLFSIFTCSTRCEGSEILNYRNGLVSALWLYQKQPSLCSVLTWHTLSHTWLWQFKPCMNRWKEKSTVMHFTYWLYWNFFNALIVTYHTYLFLFLSTCIFHARCIRVEQQESRLDVGALAEVPGCAVPLKATRCWLSEKNINMSGYVSFIL